MNKIAIQGHPSRGKEVIQILESLGGKNKWLHSGTYENLFYELHDDGIRCTNKRSKNFKYYTLEEFEKEFPFKIGDRVISLTTGLIGTITKLSENGIYHFKYDNGIYSLVSASYLKLYKEMKEERNITLTLDKAKEWYKKGGELKEVALQAYSEEELTKIELPKTWKEFCKNYPIKIGEAYIDDDSEINIIINNELRDKTYYKNLCPSKKSAEAHLALIQLEQLRDCYRQGDIPDFNDDKTKKYCIIKIKNDISVRPIYNTSSFLTFTKRKVAEEFLTNFKPLIKIAEDYI